MASSMTLRQFENFARPSADDLAHAQAELEQARKAQTVVLAYGAPFLVAMVEAGLDPALVHPDDRGRAGALIDALDGQVRQLAESLALTAEGAPADPRAEAVRVAALAFLIWRAVSQDPTT